MILAIIQARISSSRFPGKVLKPILGFPMLARQIERIRRAKLIDHLIVATTDDMSDNSIENLCIEIKVECFRGKMDDVLDRFYQAANFTKPKHIIRLTGDCPLVDPELIDEMIQFHLNGDYDYTSNTVEPTYPDGIDVEIFRLMCLEQAWREAKLPSQREHVTPFINQQPERFKTGSYKQNINLSHLRWTVDELLDFEVVSKIYEFLYPQHPEFTTQDILAILDEKPELKTLNTCYQRNEGFKDSLLADELFLKKASED